MFAGHQLDAISGPWRRFEGELGARELRRRCSRRDEWRATRPQLVHLGAERWAAMRAQLHRRQATHNGRRSTQWHWRPATCPNKALPGNRVLRVVQCEASADIGGGRAASALVVTFRARLIALVPRAGSAHLRCAQDGGATRAPEASRQAAASARPLNHVDEMICWLHYTLCAGAPSATLWPAAAQTASGDLISDKAAQIFQAPALNGHVKRSARRAITWILRRWRRGRRCATRSPIGSSGAKTSRCGGSRAPTRRPRAAGDN